MKNKEIANIFDRIADALEFKGEQVFRVLAYRKAARIIEELSEDIEVLNKEGKLRDIPGIGEGIAKKIDEYLKTGKMKKFQEAMQGIPQELLELLNIQNLGPKTLKLANEKLGVKNLSDLKKVIEDGSLAKLFRMGEKKVDNIRKGIILYEQGQKRIPIDTALQIAEMVVDYLKKAPGILDISPSGSLRRMKETIGDIDILVTGKDGDKIIDYFTKMPEVTQVLASGSTKGSVIIGSGEEAIQVDVRFVEPKSYGSALQYFTGSKEHNIKLRSLAKEKGLKLSEYGVYRNEKYLAGKTEEEVYKILGLLWIPPEIREDRGEIEAALANKLPKLIGYDEIRGDLQVHSNYSDGAASIEDIVQAGIKLGYEYIAITDHSKTAQYAGGLSEDHLKMQWDEIDKVQDKYKKIKILKGVEVDILKSGKLDFSDRVLSNLDIVLAAIHQGFKQNVTERICSAIENPYVDIIAHPTGRLINKREGYDVDLEKVLEHAQKYEKILEINAYPNRLDLNDIWARRAKEMGIKLAINTDAHGVLDLNWMRFGIGVARRAWLEKQDVINAMKWQDLKKLLIRRRKGKDNSG
ncbi:MAG: DNA polymerase/3'-5' exonuclease PolX [candidate division WOR-3 bacterium]|nr:DNA polymerase/3'-5' exonuclease PolX [candidate division WOR-3 bacterium]